MLRSKPGWEHFEDIPYVDNDAKNVKKGFKELGANDNDIQTYEDVTFSEFSKIKNKMREEIFRNWIEKR